MSDYDEADEILLRHTGDVEPAPDWFLRKLLEEADELLDASVPDRVARVLRWRRIWDQIR